MSLLCAACQWKGKAYTIKQSVVHFHEISVNMKRKMNGLCFFPLATCPLPQLWNSALKRSLSTGQSVSASFSVTFWTRGFGIFYRDLYRNKRDLFTLGVVVLCVMYSILDNRIHILKSAEVFNFSFSRVSASSIDMRPVFLLYYFGFYTSLHFTVLSLCLSCFLCFCLPPNPEWVHIIISVQCINNTSTDTYKGAHTVRTSSPAKSAVLWRSQHSCIYFIYLHWYHTVWTAFWEIFGVNFLFLQDHVR